MDFKEAIEKVVEIIPDDRLTEFTEVIDTIKAGNAIESGAEDWETKYKELSSEYKKRFIENLNTEVMTDEKPEVDKPDKPEEVSLKDLDFSAETE